MKKINSLLTIVALALVLGVSLSCSPALQQLFDPIVIPEIIPTLVSNPPPSTAYDTLATLEETLIPQRDLVSLAQRLNGAGEIPLVVREAPYDYQLGAEASFWVSNLDTDEHSQITATLAHVTPHLYVWVETGVEVDLDALRSSAERFEVQTYPTNRRYFGSEWSPGVDNDVHLNILHATGLGSNVAGYYSSSDEYSHLAHAYSNEREMFYANLDAITVGSDYYDGVLAHEFQHMIHWHTDRNEDLWLNEGFSKLASYLNGFDYGTSAFHFMNQPDLQLNHFSYGDADSSAHYGASYLFTHYFLDRFGEEATQALVAHPANGPAGINAVLSRLDETLDFQDLFADWAAALYLDDPNLADGRYGYSSIDPGRPVLSAEHSEYPIQVIGTVHQYASDYIRLLGDNPVTVIFTGTQQVPLVGTSAHGGQFLWWSNRGDDADATLTRAFDLSGLEAVTLDYWLWYDIEEGWDYAYLELSTDGGKTWETLQTPYTTEENPAGNNYGHGYTGMSGDGSSSEWIHEQVNLNAYAGQFVLLRFEYVTDGAIHNAGLVLDDLSILELNYYDGFESEDTTWEAAGFVRSDNVLPQEYQIQLIELGDKPRVRQLSLNVQGQARWQVPLDNETGEAILVISAVTPVTLESASYAYQVVPAE